MGAQLHRLARVDSTMDRLHELAAGGAPAGTAVMGAGPAVPVYISPYAVAIDPNDSKYTMSRAAANTNVPGRAGEFSTMTNGVPNVETNNAP